MDTPEFLKHQAQEPSPKVAMPTPSPDKRHKEALSWEASRIGMIEASEHRAWRVAFIAGVLVVFSWLAIILMLPLKESVPYLVRVDNHTGYTDIVTALTDKEVTYNDVMDKYWVGKFVRARESYNYYSLQDNYNDVLALSAPPVFKEYATLFEGDGALHLKKRDHERVTIELYSIVPNGRGTATVRYGKTLTVIEQGTETSSAPQKWVATVEYEYLNTAKVPEKWRLVNPLGFFVRGYRVDPEMSSAPAVASSAPSFNGGAP